jgi:hypothetical protein
MHGLRTAGGDAGGGRRYRARLLQRDEEKFARDLGLFPSLSRPTASSSTARVADQAGGRKPPSAGRVAGPLTAGYTNLGHVLVANPVAAFVPKGHAVAVDLVTAFRPKQ